MTPNRPVLRYHGPETLFFIDPPYVHSTRNMRRRNSRYVHEMSDADHRSLADRIRGARGMVMLSGYDCDLYRELYGDWKLYQRKAMADGAKPRTECVWMNAAAEQARKDVRRSVFDVLE
jgi:DNA adenine methylase